MSCASYTEDKNQQASDGEHVVDLSGLKEDLVSWISTAASIVWPYSSN